MLPLLGLSPVNGQTLTARFDGGTLSSDTLSAHYAAVGSFVFPGGPTATAVATSDRHRVPA